jgi:hypothetical protein
MGRAIDSRIGVYGSAMNQMRRDLSWLMSVVNVEEKYVDTLFASNTMSNGIGSQSLLNGMTTGNSSVTRNGQSIKMSKLKINIIATVGTTSPVNCRFIVFLDKAANASTTGVSSIFQAATDGASDYALALYNVATIGLRIAFLLDVKFELDTVNNTRYILNRTINLGQHVRYNTGTAGTIADISENSLYFCALSSAAATQPTFKGAIRLTFTDN